MTDLIIFNVKENRYALNIENIQRIIQAQELTPIPNAHPYVEGMMSYEERVIKVVSFRKMVNMESYEEELKSLFTTLKGQHKEWIDALKHSVANHVQFQKTTDPHQCDLGKWLDNFTSYDDNISEILKGLNQNHKALHKSAETILEVNTSHPEKAEALVNTQAHMYYERTMGAVDVFTQEFETVANSLQKLLIYQNEEALFAIKVDAIVDIAHIDASTIKEPEESNKVSEFLELEGIIELNDVLVNVIKEVSLPQPKE